MPLLLAGYLAHLCAQLLVADRSCLAGAVAPPCRYENCEMRTIVLADEGGAHSHHDQLHFHGGHSVSDS